jgi:hypothetical protein
MDNLKIWTYIGITSPQNPLDFKFVLVNAILLSPKEDKLVFILHRDRWKYVTYSNQAAQCEMGLDFYCKFKQNQEMTKIAFPAKKFHPNNFTLKSLHGCKTTFLLGISQ